MDNSAELRQQSFSSSVFFHAFTGVLVLVFQLLTVDVFFNRGYPPYISGLIGFLFVSIPIQLTIIMTEVKSIEDLSIIDLLGKSIEKPYKIVLPVIFTFYIFAVLFTPVSNWFQQEVFYWLPEWLLVPFPIESIQDNRLLSAFILTLTIDGLLNPIVEELYWRGYLLKKVTRFGIWAPVFNGLLFGLQHFWQPFNYILIIPFSILLSYIVWRKGDLRLSIVLHCTINLLGALITYIPLLF